jgi:hypothetical protein
MAPVPVSTYLVRILLGLLAAWIAVVVHECGHLVAGLSAGWRFDLLVIGPLRLGRGPDGRVRLDWNRDIAMIGGAGGATPTRTTRLREAMAINAAGGPLASLLLALAAHLALVGPYAAHGALAIFCGWLRLISGGIGVINLVPMANGPFVTDGLRLLRVLGRGPHGAREIALLTLCALEARGVPPRDWDAALVESGLAVRDGSMFECQFELWACQRARDSGRLDAAGLALERALALAPRAPLELREACQREEAALEVARRGSTRPEGSSAHG